ncbi:hypothetical protein MAXJ12_27988 [Mesorhizobium alhagi CCNWXJ12-2]|uniref:Uncharacterized protein n=1 Tax=Mesorhizobium alhagi CCNWXJ12-2 TaxID=1107882 RepID=H0HZG4_9HYPH|nr:hypothetical protein MAXJ12_27988 [Mesorhizobium alhagi CCNWXJ12-2]
MTKQVIAPRGNGQFVLASWAGSFDHDDLAPKLKFSKCGGKKISLSLRLPSGLSDWANPLITSKD